jgi:hypothetical protein
MPKVKVSQKTELQMHRRELERDVITMDKKILYCRVCEKTVGCEIRALQHLNTNVHKENTTIKSMKSASVQELLS